MNALLWIVLDLLLAGLLLGLAWAAVMTRDLKRGVVLFIAFGLLLAVAWARLRAPDLALAEAAIGAGIAGALLLAALRDEPPIEERALGSHAIRDRRLLDIGIVALAGVVGWALLDALAYGEGGQLAAAVREQLALSGVSHPVTAVLLNFRAYDTLLELAVILTAVLGVLALGPARASYRHAGSVLRSLIRGLVPVLMVTAGYLLWVGAHAPGGAFQAGATLAAVGVLLRLGGDDRAGLPATRALRWLLVAGVGVFVLVGLLVTVAGLAVLQYPKDWAGALILLIETAATLSIAAALALAYLGGRPVGWDPSPAAHASLKQKVSDRC
jgi:multisubunit Na+/H+ antiporter MnhB subunit